jgi:hypothetical protein
MITDEQLDEWARAAAAATCQGTYLPEDGRCFGECCGLRGDDEEYVFILAAFKAVPALIAEVRQLRAERAAQPTEISEFGLRAILEYAARRWEQAPDYLHDLDVVKALEEIESRKEGAK